MGRVFNFKFCVINLGYVFLCGWINSFFTTVNTENRNAGYTKFFDDWNHKAVTENNIRHPTWKSVGVSYSQGWADGFQKGWGTSNLTRSVLIKY